MQAQALRREEAAAEERERKDREREEVRLS